MMTSKWFLACSTTNSFLRGGECNDLAGCFKYCRLIPLFIVSNMSICGYVTFWCSWFCFGVNWDT